MLALRHYSTMLKPKHCEECFFGRLVAESCEFAGLQNAAIRRFLDHTMKGVVANREPGSYYVCVCACVLSLFNVTYYMPGGPSRISFTGVPMFVQENADFQRPCRKNRDQEIGFMKI